MRKELQRIYSTENYDGWEWWDERHIKQGVLLITIRRNRMEHLQAPSVWDIRTGCRHIVFWISDSFHEPSMVYGSHCY